MKTPFPPNKTAEELGIDLKRTFVVMKTQFPGKEFFQVGEIISYVGFNEEKFVKPGAIFKNHEGKVAEMFWCEIAYADGPEPEAYVPAVGDRVSLEAEIVRVYTSDRPRCDVKLLLPNITLIIVPVEDLARAKLLSRKTRKLTKEEAHPSPTKTASV